MIGLTLLCLMVGAVLIAIRSAEIASDLMFEAPVVRALGWIGIAVLALMILIAQWAAYMQLPTGGSL